ncbi:tyrosine-type recombinase/integrase [Salipaludibacillus sp. HK11]|uniref:tyrosine-type recombinase/integrase n=1 Tax=Salipaludibacillus sp. HK11 TaxID=3394320 RepID=UPI0039FDB220
MEYVHPIKDLEKLRMMKSIIKMKSSRDNLLFVLGINTGLRISEILPLKFQHLLDEQGQSLSFLHINNVDIYLNDQVKQAISEHILSTSYTYDQYLFKSKKGLNPITRQQAYRMIHDAARKAGVYEQIGTHTLRKTFGYHAYLKGIAISLIQKRLHHTSPAETLKYIGIDHNQRQRLDVNL